MNWFKSGKYFSTSESVKIDWFNSKKYIFSDESVKRQITNSISQNLTDPDLESMSLSPVISKFSIISSIFSIIPSLYTEVNLIFYFVYIILVAKWEQMVNYSWVAQYLCYYPTSSFFHNRITFCIQIMHSTFSKLEYIVWNIFLLVSKSEFKSESLNQRVYLSNWFSGSIFLFFSKFGN